MGNNISLTDPGRRLLTYADDILHNLESGTVTIAADDYDLLIPFFFLWELY